MVTPEIAPESGRDVRPSGPGIAASAAMTSSRETISDPFRSPRVERPVSAERRGSATGRQSSVSRNVTTVPMMMIAGPLSSGRPRLRGQGSERADDDPLIGRAWRCRRSPPANPAFAPRAMNSRVSASTIAQPHIDRNRLARLQERRPVEIDLAVLPVAGHEHAGLRVVAMGEGNARIGRRADRRGNARADLKRDPLRGERFDLLAAAAEHEGIAALETQHPLALLGELDQQRADLALRQFVVVRLLADIDALRLAPHEVHHARVGEPVVEHDVGLLHEAQGAEGQKIGIAGPRADEIDFAARRLGVLGRGAFDRAGKFGVGGASRRPKAPVRRSVPRAPSPRIAGA